MTIRVFEPEGGRTLADYVLPVDSPDAEHAAASTLANAASFTPKMEGDTPRPSAFRVVSVSTRR